MRPTPLKITGYTRKEIIGKISDNFNTFVNSKKNNNAFKELLKRGHIENYESKIRCKDGTLLEGLLSAEMN